MEKKLTDHVHNEYIATSEFNKLTTENFAAKSAQKKLILTDFEKKFKPILIIK